jgi:hypothetical protein
MLRPPSLRQSPAKCPSDRSLGSSSTRSRPRSRRLLRWRLRRLLGARTDYGPRFTSFRLRRTALRMPAPELARLWPCRNERATGRSVQHSAPLRSDRSYGFAPAVRSTAFERDVLSASWRYLPPQNHSSPCPLFILPSRQGRSSLTGRGRSTALVTEKIRDLRFPIVRFEPPTHGKSMPNFFAFRTTDPVSRLSI